MSAAARRAASLLAGPSAWPSQGTVAEGAVDDRTLELLRDLGVDYAQGYGIAPRCSAVRSAERGSSVHEAGGLPHGVRRAKVTGRNRRNLVCVDVAVLSAYSRLVGFDGLEPPWSAQRDRSGPFGTAFRATHNPSRGGSNPPWPIRLDAAERSALERLAVFAGGATVPMAEQVTAEAAETFERLADKQLLVVSTSSRDGPRLSLLETIRAFASALLAERDDADAVHGRHADAFAAHAARLADELRRTDTPDVAARFERDLDNIRAALSWAIRRREPQPALQLASGLQEYLWQRSAREGERWLRAALAVPGADAFPALRAQCLWCFAMLPMWLSELSGSAEFEAAARSSFGLFDALDDARGRADSRMALASVLFVAHRHPEALAAAHEALAWARRAGEPITLADSLNACAILEPRFEDGLRHGEEAGALFSTLGNHFRSATVWSNLGYVALARGENATAAALIAEARAEILKTVNDFGDAVVRTNEGLLALLRGVPEEAAALLAQVVVFAARAGTGAVLSEAVDALAAAAAARGQDETGARLHGAARALCAAPHHPDLESRLRASFFGPARARLGSVRWDAAFAAGARMDTQQIVECCRRLAARVSLDRPSRL